MYKNTSFINLIKSCARYEIGYIVMSKTFFVATAIFVCTIVTLANAKVQRIDLEGSNHKMEQCSMAGDGACTHKGCACTKFDQRPGYYQCWCGHQRYVHK